MIGSLLGGFITDSDRTWRDNIRDSVALDEGPAVVGTPAHNARPANYQPHQLWLAPNCRNARPATPGSSFGIAAAASGTTMIVSANGYRRSAGGRGQLQHADRPDRWVLSISRSIDGRSTG